MKAARTVFLEHGYEAASVNDIVRIAGGSLATLYSQFGNKEGLFLAVAKEQLSQFSSDSTPKSEGLSFEEYLQAFGESLVHAVLSKDHLAFYRIFVGEGRQFPQLLQAYLSTGAAELRKALAGRLSLWAGDNGVIIANPEMMAAFFVDLCRSRLHYQALADSAFVASDQDIREHVARAVTMFLKGVRG